MHLLLVYSSQMHAIAAYTHVRTHTRTYLSSSGFGTSLEMDLGSRDLRPRPACCVETSKQKMESANTEADQVSEAAKEFAVLARELQENLTKAEAKNESLLEAIESSESKSTAGQTSDAPLLRNLRARLAAAHAPNAALRRELGRFMGLFERRFKDLDRMTKEYSKLLLELKVEKRHFEEDKEDVQKRKRAFEKEREEWREKLEDARTEIQEQNDRLAVLADQLSGAKVALDSQTRDLASRRLAFEEEKLERDDREFTALDTEAEELRQRLREQIVRNSKLEDSLLQAELALHQKVESVMSLSATKERLQRDLMQSRQACSKALRQFEKRTNEGMMPCAALTCAYCYAHLHKHVLCREVLGSTQCSPSPTVFEGVVAI